MTTLNKPLPHRLEPSTVHLFGEKKMNLCRVIKGFKIEGNKLFWIPGGLMGFKGTL